MAAHRVEIAAGVPVRSGDDEPPPRKAVLHQPPGVDQRVDPLLRVNPGEEQQRAVVVRRRLLQRRQADPVGRNRDRLREPEPADVLVFGLRGGVPARDAFQRRALQRPPERPLDRGPEAHRPRRQRAVGRDDERGVGGAGDGGWLHGAHSPQAVNVHHVRPATAQLRGDEAPQRRRAAEPPWAEAGIESADERKKRARVTFDGGQDDVLTGGPQPVAQLKRGG